MNVTEKAARALVEELGDNYEACVGDVDVHYAEVNIVAPKELPNGFLEVVSHYGDMRVEGIRQETDEVELSVLI